MNYVIEGTVSELTKKDAEHIFKISGTEGFALKSKKGDKEIKR